MKHITYFGFGLVLSFILLSLSVTAQDSAQSKDQSNPQAQASSGSLGDYARHVRKDSGQDKAKPKVFDNDNLPKEDKLSVIGEKPAASAENSSETKPQESSGNTSTPAAGENKAAPATPAKPSEEDAAQKKAVLKQWQEKITAQREQIDLMQRELDVLQREYQIRAAAFYADAGNRLRNSGAWDKQDADYKQQIATKQKGLEDARQKLEDMQEEARKAGVPVGMREQ